MIRTPDTGSALLTICRRVLSENGFRVEERQLDGAGETNWLVAESEYFILGVAAGETLEDLLGLEGFVAGELGALVKKAELGPKRWDSYVVLLATADKEQRGTPAVVGLEHNTRSLRRIVCLGTAAHEEAVVRALANFLPLPEPPAGGLPSAFDELVQQLVLNGVAKEEASVAVEGYRSSGGRHGA